MPNEREASASPGELPRGDVGADPQPITIHSCSSLLLPGLGAGAGAAAAAAAAPEAIGVVVPAPFEVRGHEVPRFCLFCLFFSKDDVEGCRNAKSVVTECALGFRSFSVSFVLARAGALTVFVFRVELKLKIEPNQDDVCRCCCVFAAFRMVAYSV